ncbi:hypothetical protein EW145_g6283 [Phellinidium pouzarii]|uniref:Uncharacterized protein n=1 Tax=Phellinidium pouzarii TaxID=167371 RepID=A0A4S4KX72_9AGAM|nr:hypothetical protein EW145_g6283 [Phellinidium pouzarii]
MNPFYAARLREQITGNHEPRGTGASRSNHAVGNAPKTEDLNITHNIHHDIVSDLCKNDAVYLTFDEDSIERDGTDVWDSISNKALSPRQRIENGSASMYNANDGDDEPPVGSGGTTTKESDPIISAKQVQPPVKESNDEEGHNLSENEIEERSGPITRGRVAAANKGNGKEMGNVIKPASPSNSVGPRARAIVKTKKTTRIPQAKSKAKAKEALPEFVRNDDAAVTEAGPSGRPLRGGSRTQTPGPPPAPTTTLTTRKIRGKKTVITDPPGPSTATEGTRGGKRRASDDDGDDTPKKKGRTAAPAAPARVVAKPPARVAAKPAAPAVARSAPSSKPAPRPAPAPIAAAAPVVTTPFVGVRVTRSRRLMNPPANVAATAQAPPAPAVPTTPAETRQPARSRHPDATLAGRRPFRH